MFGSNVEMTKLHTHKPLSRHAFEWLIVAIPMMVYGAAYRLLRFVPRVMPIDTRELYDAEVSLFGIGGRTWCEHFAANPDPVLDVVSAVCYICWVPLPILFAFFLYFTRRRLCLHFTTGFMIMNLIGFACYYLHPAAPPWYVMAHGFVADPDTPGCAAGLLRFDAIVGYPLFENMYRGTTNVFAPIPSLHSAKVPYALLFAYIIYIKERARDVVPWLVLLFVISAGTWFAAVYTQHHYIIDVVCGIALVPVSYLIFCCFIRPRRWFQRLEAMVA